LRRLLILASALILGCIGEHDLPGIPGGNANINGTTTTSGTGGGQLLDGEGGEQPACCVKDKTAPFEGPSWFVITGDGSPGTCPESTIDGLKGHAEMKPIAPHTCGACSCSPAACTLPEGIHTNAAKCPGDGSIAVPFGPDPAGGWEGACSEEGALPANLQCNGEPCAQSLSIPVLPVAPCSPETVLSEPFPDPEWARWALQCKIGPLSGEGCSADYVCAPSPPEGLSLCLYVEGEVTTCPAEYPAQMVFYRGVEDERDCTPCQCSAQQGAQCLAIVSTFSDGVCGMLAGAVVVSDQDASCFDVIPGTALGSAQASMVTDVPGSCAPSGGAPFGELVPADPLTLCCQGIEEPPG